MEDIKEENKKENKEEVKETPKIADSTNFKELYAVKGERGIFISRGMPNKSNLLGMLLWRDVLNPQSRSKVVNVQNLVSLASLRFYTTDKKTITVPKFDEEGNIIYKKSKSKDQKDKEFETEEKEIDVVLSIKDVFNNLNEYENTLQDDLTVEDYDLNNTDTCLNLMDIAVPNYDPEEFKPYHLKKVIKYYVWFKEALVEFNNYNKEQNSEKEAV